MHWTGWLLIIACAPAVAAQDCYTADASGGAVEFHVLQQGAPFSGQFRSFTGNVCLEQGRIAHIEASLDPSSVDTGLPELDAALKGMDFFDVSAYPRVTFSGAAVQIQGNTQTVHGMLEIKGNRRAVEVVLHTQQAGSKMSISGSLTLDRLQYAIGTGDWTNTKWLGADVQVDVSATMIRK
jgi:polyisoprenoid-binding protein YceI